MQSTPKNNNDNPVGTGDRLSFTVFVALALHGLIIFGLGFSYMSEPATPPTFQVTLATHKSAQAPDKADFQAQFNQEASGTEDEARELSTRDPALFADTQINEVHPLPQTEQREASKANDENRLHTTGESSLKISRQEDPEDRETEQEKKGQEQDIPLVNAEIASLRAKLDRLQQSYSKRPRIRRYTSVASVASAEAAYLNDWRQRVESFGNENFPAQALQQGIFGELRLATVLKADGTIVKVELLQSSGHSVLDNAALQIVHRAGPYAPFPGEVRKEWDQMEIIRTWRFAITGLSTSN
ncbi:energy transducer TonB [Gilvimarinus sp. F26214L]|uniref:energy transducer TonB n=1 Tax=Gilvimarinus sp. DZF01 TaxID=3461371 RepID=UPI0040461CA0